MGILFNMKLITSALWSIKIRADQNTGGAILEFPMRTAMHGKSRLSSAISVCVI